MKVNVKDMLLGVLTSLFWIGSIQAQDTLMVSKADFLSKINDKNWNVILADKAYESAKADYHQSRALFLPQIGFSYTAMTTTNPLMAFGSKLNQATITASDFNPDLLNNPERTDNFATEFEVIQPLINIDGLYARQAAQAKMEAMAFSAKRTIEWMQIEVSKSYMELQLAYRTIGVMERAEEAAAASFKIAQDYFDLGMLQLPDLIAVEVYLSDVQNQRLIAESYLKKTSEYLAFLVQDSIPNSVYKPNEVLDEKLELPDLNPSLSPERSDIKAMNLSAEAYEKMFQASKFQFLPRLNAFGKYLIYDEEFLSGNASGYWVGAQLSWKIFDGYKSIGATQKAKFEYERVQIEASEYSARSELEIKDYQRKLISAKQNVEIHKRGMGQYAEALRIRQDRYAEGLEKTSDVLMTQVQHYQKELAYFQAVFEYQFTYQYLKFLTK